jgi:protein-disulfide isomerase
MSRTAVPGAPLLLAAAVAGVLLIGAPACAQSPQGETAAGRDRGAAAMPRDSVLARAERSRFRGTEGAPVVIYEVSDFQCPFCARFVEETYAALDSAYIQPGHVRLVFVNLPLPNHPDAWAASEAALCAGVQDRFWPMHDLLFARQREWSEGGLSAARAAEYAASIGLDVPQFRHCVENDEVAPIIISDLMQATSAGIGGTPTFIINGQDVVSGAVPFEQLRERIDPLLAGAPARQP